MAEEPQKPLASQALLDYLSTLYPNRAPSLVDLEREVWFKAGQVSVVEKLKADVRDATRKEE